jgi:transposase-like protein
MPSVLADARFRDEAAAYDWVESRVWPDGPVCPHCRETKCIHKIKPNPARKVRLGLHAWGACRKQFTVKVGTVFESSHVPLHVWLQAMHLMCSSKKGISSNQLHRLLGVALKTAWFMSHRIREAMKTGGLDPLGGAGKAVEADETYYGEKADPAERRKPGQRGPAGKRPVGRPGRARRQGPHVPCRESRQGYGRGYRPAERRPRGNADDRRVGPLC